MCDNQFVERALPNVAEGWMPEIVRKTRRLNHLRIQPPPRSFGGIVFQQLLREAPTNLGNLDRVLLTRVEHAGLAGTNDLSNACEALKR